jgi:predicted protein tyrosine phosphatase
MSPGNYSNRDSNVGYDGAASEQLFAVQWTAISGVPLMDTFAPFRISICGIAELAGHCRNQVSHVLSILDPDWPVPEAFGDFGEHARLELRFHDVIETDHPEAIAPQEAHILELLTFGRELRREPRANAHLLVHCHAGISRSTASMALLLAQALPAVSGERIFDAILCIRPQAWPNLRILEIGDQQLGRGGGLVMAASGLYRTRLEADPDLAGQMRAGGRGREVAVALSQGNLRK